MELIKTHKQPLTYAEWVNELRENPCRRPLTATEEEAFDRGYRDNWKSAVRLARRVTGGGWDEAWDIVHGALTRMIRKITEDKMPIPPDAPSFRRRFLGYVQRVARQAGAGPGRFKPSVRKFWGESLAPVSHRKVHERELRVDFDEFMDNPRMGEDVGAPHVVLKRPTRYGPAWGQPDRTERLLDLNFIIECACEMLPDMQRELVELWLDGKKRREICKALRISPATYDTYWERAKENMRFTLLVVEWLAPNHTNPPDGIHWSDWNNNFKVREAWRLARLAAAPDRDAA